ncbi:MAG: PQQ-dependent sugar dehydrogenase [Cytophagaceae bacterium]|nr:PQQ-dependent sugar dehydrogenase [Cytophagaceae bacterium]MBL0302437.1 PQQ-dependent sugar dehydrogenase [Cytophagaceae bacterium]MBL0325263.1 PQQ-dependent sugar dehydrogenase [Cytophagaceae bacterium]
MFKITISVLLSIMAWFGMQADKPTPPDWKRFTKVVLAEGLDEPMEMAFLPGNKVLIVERKGGVKIINEKTKEVLDAGFIEVNTKYTNKKGQIREAEEGLMGVTLDPKFATNHWVYLYYAHPKEAKHVLTRFVLKDDALVMESEKLILEVKTQREECCHTGGGLAWDKAGNLFLTVGNNTVNPPQGSSNLVETPGHENEDDQRGPGNTNDLRGKILRIHPEANGTYTIPKGNLFPAGTEKTRPEIYTMGHRNPWRINIDSKTGYIYWGEVGPDAGKDSTWGPKGYDEFNQAKGPGFFGWPYFIGNNKPYRKYNSETKTYGEPFDPNNPVNNSVNNTGLVNLPKPMPAMLYYPYGQSPEFPELGTSGRSATGGPVFRKADFVGAPRPWPDYYEGKWLITDFMRGWIFAITMDEKGDYQSMERVLPDMNFSSAIDMDFGPSGDMYVLEYGSAWFRGNANSKLVKIEYNAGNRRPSAVAFSDKNSGSLPLTVKFSAEGSSDFDDYDQNKLTYKWKITDAKKAQVALLSGKEATYTFKLAGNYNVTLEVTDTKGAKNSISIPVTAGNAAPEIEVVLSSPNQTFYFGKEPINYVVKVKDKEDGETGSKIKDDEVAVTFDFIPQGFDPIEIAAKQKSADDMAQYAIGRNLIEASDCKSCHQYATKSIGPSYKDVAGKYAKTPDNMNYLVKKIKEGGSGVWGEHGMSAHPNVSDIDAKRMVDYIFSLGGAAANVPRLGLTGKVEPIAPTYENAGGNYVLRAAYKDKGAAKTKSILSEKMLYLRSQYLRPQDLSGSSSVQIITTLSYSFSFIGDKSYGFYKNIDLTSIKEVVAFLQVNSRNGAVGANVELRLDSPTGKLLGVSEFVGNKEVPFERPPAGAGAAEWARARSTKATIKLNEAVNGKHDVYLVFRNEKAQKTDILAQFNEVGFFN